MDSNINNKAIYLQIADRICDDVMLGVTQPSERIPSVRETAAQLQVNPNTVMRSYEWLDREGIIYNKRGIGYFVSTEARSIITALRREQFLNSEIGYFFKQLMTLDITPEQLCIMYQNYLTSNNNNKK